MSRSILHSSYKKWKISTMGVTDLESIVSEFPDKPWDWGSLSYNTSISFEMYFKFPDQNWNWLGLSTKATGKLLLDHPNLPWVWHVVSKHIELNFIESNPQFSWDYWVISRREDLTADFVSKHLHMFWDLSIIASNIALDLNFIGETRHLLDMNYVSSREDITPEFVDIHPDWGWVMGCLVKNTNFSLSWFEAKKYSPNEIELVELQRRTKMQVSFSKAVNDENLSLYEFAVYATKDNVVKFMEMADEGVYMRDFVWFWFACVSDITLDFILRHKDKPWNWSVLSSNSIVTEKFVGDNLNLPWDWDELWVKNPNIGCNFILRHKDRISDLWISPKITFDFLRRFSEESISFGSLSWNTCFSAEIYRYYSDRSWDYHGLSMISCLDSEQYLRKNFQIDCGVRRSSIAGVLKGHLALYPLADLICEYVSWE